MIIIDLACDHGHSFEGWFQSNSNYENQSEQGLISCPNCGSSNVCRMPSAIHLAKNKALVPQEKAAARETEGDFYAELRHLLSHILTDSEDVGEDFADEARKIFYNESPHRIIHGEASLKDYEELRDEGIEVMLIPAVPKRKNIN